MTNYDKHLGRTADGSISAPYQQPLKHDASLLVAIPRALGREKANIDTKEMFGFEAWHAYEMSYLSPVGQPKTGILKITYPCTSQFMVESKSLKLYLNSFDLEKTLGPNIVEDLVRQDLSNLLNENVDVYFHGSAISEVESSIFNEQYKFKFNSADNFNIPVEQYDDKDNELLLAFTRSARPLYFHTANLRSNCEITNQKDTGNCFIYIDSEVQPTFESLYKFVISFRNSQHFHENTTEIMYNILNKSNTNKLLVANLYNRRGGIDIHSVRATSYELIESMMPKYSLATYLFPKTFQS